MSNFIKIVLAIVACVCMVMLTRHADAQSPPSNCNTVTSDLSPCLSYLQKGGSVSSKCCDGVRRLDQSASTTAVRRATCECLKREARAHNVNATYASSLPRQCHVNLGYPISYSVNCSSVQ